MSDLHDWNDWHGMRQWRRTTRDLIDPTDLIGASDVIAICGWKTRKSIGDQTSFPVPVASPSGFRLWTRTQVTAWHANRTHKPPASPSDT